MRIGGISLDNPLIMAPMAGYTDLAFRLLVKGFGCALVTTEMVSAYGLVYANKHSCSYLVTVPQEAPLSVQLFGADPLLMARAAEMAQRQGASIVDINMGCPVKKVVKTGAGAALLKDLGRIKALLGEVRRAVTCPLTIKIRSGWRPGEIVARDVALLAQDLGVDAVTVHPRTAREGFSGRANWGIIKEVKESVSIPVIGNGDVKDASQVQKMMDLTGCDGVMIGRAALGNPWIFAQALELGKKRPLSPPSLEEREAVIKRHFALSKQYLPLARAIGKMRGQVMLYVKGLPRCSAFRREMQKVKTQEQFMDTLEHYFSFLRKERSFHEG